MKADDKKLKVLVIEDEPAIAETIAYALGTEGYEPIQCSTGGEGRKALEKQDISLLILDVNLPDINGFELCREIRKTSTLPVIFLTARSDEVDRVVGLEIGGDDYIVKPFSPRELTARVRAVLRRTTRINESSQKTLTGESFPFLIDEDRLSLSYFGKEIALSRYEFGILQTFVSHPGHVYSRRQLMELVWPEPESSWERTVDAHIKALRRKLKAVKPKVDPIITHRGFGYSLKEDW